MVNIVHSAAWSFQKCAQAIADRVPGVTINGPQKASSLNYFMSHRCTQSGNLPHRTMAFFTHQDYDGDFAQFAPRTCAQVCMNETAFAALRAIGASHPVLIRPGVDTQKPITFGICGRAYPDGRKGQALVARMVEAGYTVRAHGRGWPVPDATHGDDLAGFYASIDYLVVTATREGGPMPVVEAIAAGVPVVAPIGVGWCDDFPCIRYDAGDWLSLKRVLHGLTHPPTWDQWAEAHATLFQEILAAHTPDARIETEPAATSA